MSDILKALAANIVSRKQAGLEPYILFIGAGASLGSGCSSMLGLVDDVLQSHDSAQFSAWQEEISKAEAVSAKFGELLRDDINKKKISRFMDIWGNLDGDGRFAILRNHLWDNKTPSSGYIDLAHLVKSGYFNIILSTNLDNLMEKALNKVELFQPENFIVVVNGKDSTEEVKEQLESKRVPVKLIKLHGSLESPRSYAFTVEEIFSFEKNIKASLARIINQSLLIVGHSMQDRDINVLFEEEGKEIHFVNPARPETGSAMDNILKVRDLGSIIEGEQGKFDAFFGQLRRYVESASEEANTDGLQTTIDGFLQKIGYGSELKAPHSRYKNLHTLYVKPTEYDDILDKLERDHVLFIIGEPHMGKTYTAMYLLWEYYQNGYETIHIRHDNLIQLLHQHDRNLKELLLKLFTPTNQCPRIVHFDDPFGETLERRTDVFSGGLDTFLELARAFEHLRVVVTSRLNIFNEAVAESRSGSSNLEELEKTLRVHTSYRREVLLDILQRDTRFYKPAWFSDEQIVAALNEKLPEMLPAPHNIEFFVRTSESLNSPDAVLAHVEESKKMISALASWMKHMSPHEQIFLMWVEICSGSSFLFSNTFASVMDIEKAYKENLAYLFSEGYLPGIPAMPFSSAKDKFETILLERREETTGMLHLDFVHPSYHEAFWYAVKRKFPLSQWWELLCANRDDILRNLDKSIDLVQLRMIERYGTINRDLNQLLIISAESEDINEQFIALEHMLEHTEQFSELPQFSHAVQSIVSKGDETMKINFLDLYHKYFYLLPLTTLSTVAVLLFDENWAVRQKAKTVISPKLKDLPESIRQEDTLKIWEILSKLLSDVVPEYSDDLYYILSRTYDERLKNNFANLTAAEICQLIQAQNEGIVANIINLADEVWDKLSGEQREAITTCGLFETYWLQERVKLLAAYHLKDMMHLKDRYSFIDELIKLQQAFNLSLEIDISSEFDKKPLKQWTEIPPASLRELANLSLFNFGARITERILENHNQIPREYRDIYLEALYSPDNAGSLLSYLDKNKYEYEELSDNVLIKLLNAPGGVQYEMLTALLIRFDRLSKKSQKIVINLVDNPPDWWVAGSVGQITIEEFSGELSKKVEDLPAQVANRYPKKAVGALLSEMAQHHFDDSDFGLQERYLPLLQQLTADSEIVSYAEDWMDYSVEVFGFYNEEYWADIKKRMRSLQKELSGK